MTSLYARHGALTLPPDVADVGDSPQAALDPGLDTLVNLFATAIAAELGEVFSLAKIGTSLADFDVVQTVLPMASSASVLKRYKVGFPLLCVSRTGEGTYAEFTSGEDILTQKWMVEYILGPLSLDDERKLGSLCVAVGKVISLTIRRGSHPDFQGGAIQFGAPYAGDDEIADGSGGARFSSVKLVSQGLGRAPFSDAPDAPEYIGIALVLETVEVETLTDTSTDLDGASFGTLETGGGGGGAEPYYFDTDQ